MAVSNLSHLKDSDFDKMTPDDLVKIASNKYKSDDEMLDDLSPDALSVIAGGASPTEDIRNDINDSSKMSAGKAALIGAQRGVSLGFRPAISGASAGLGQFIGQMEIDKKGEGLVDKIKRGFAAVPQAYEEGRTDAVKEEAHAQKDRPGITMAGDIGGNILTAPLIAAKGLSGALRLGALQGTGRAVSEGESLEDAAGKFAEGVVYGGAGYGGSKLIGAGFNAAKPFVSKAASKAGNFISEKSGQAATKVASTLTGVSEQDIRTYAKNADKVVQMIKNSGGDISEAADQVREKFASAIDKKRGELNSQISSALKNSNKVVELEPIISALEAAKGKLNANLYPEEIRKINGVIEKIRSLGPDGNLSATHTNDVKMFLQDLASSAYRNPGDPASLGTAGAQAAKSGAAIARKLLNAAEPGIAQANNSLAKIHAITDNMNKNVFRAGKPEAALVAAGSGGNSRNIKALKSLGEATGTDMVGEAQNLSAMKTFSSPQILPVDSTGKAVARMLTGAGAGTMIGGPAGAIIGSAMTSPAALKAAIDTGRVSSKVIGALIGKPLQMTEKGLAEVIEFVNTPTGQAALNQALYQQKVAQGPIERRLDRISNKNGSEK